MACKCKINNAWTAVIKFFKKENGQWGNVLSAWKKNNGVWVESSDLTQVFENNKVYVWERYTSLH